MSSSHVSRGARTDARSLDILNVLRESADKLAQVRERLQIQPTDLEREQRLLHLASRLETRIARAVDTERRQSEKMIVLERLLESNRNALVASIELAGEQRK